MKFDHSRAPGDLPAPPTPDGVAAGFAVPLLTLVAQDLDRGGRRRPGRCRTGWPARRPGTGLRIDTDRHVFGVGTYLGDRILTAVIARKHLPYLRLTFATRPEPH